MKAKRDVIWNYISMAFVALSGLMMNIIIASFYDSSTLGKFNEAYAWYMILSQIAVCGIHMSVLKYVPEQTDPDAGKDILASSVFGVLVLSVCVVLLAEFIFSFARTYVWRESLQVALTGLVFFAINKVLLNYLNALFSFVSYAVFQTVRSLCLALTVYYLSLIKVADKYLSLAFPVTEMITGLVIVLYISISYGIRGKIRLSLVKEMIGFGVRILPSYMLIEVNTKLDVVCLGFLCKDSDQIGVYSFAILIAEGFFTLYITIRKLINPGISKSNSEGKLTEYKEKMDSYIKKYNPILSPLAVVGVVGGYLLICFFMKKNVYYIGWMYIFLICSSMAINSKSVIWGDLLSQTGYPFEESVISIVSVASNLVFNVVLILLYGAYGAAIATSISYFVFAMIQRYIVKRKIGIKV